VHVLSGLKRSIQTSRKPREIRGPKMSPDGKSVYLGVLPEDQLPKVSILTITRNRRRIFNIATYMVKNTRYPKDRLEWVIVDDSDDGEDAYPSLGSLKDDPMVVYRRLRTDQGRPFRIGHKRQMSCELATGDIFVHLDDDDFLPPEGVMVRTRALLEYNASCMGATHMLSHVYKTGRTFFTTVADVYGDLVCFGEPSIAYTREFWKERPWNSEVHMDEGRYFLLGRDYDRFLNVQSHFHCVALTHGKNITGTLRDGKDIVNARNFDRSELFPPDLVRLLDSAFR
jgi:glycosyltransferase involved in cell wall biosynthesis